MVTTVGIHQWALVTGLVVTPRPWWRRADKCVTSVLDSDFRRNDVTVKLKCVTSVNNLVSAKQSETGLVFLKKSLFV